MLVFGFVRGPIKAQNSLVPYLLNYLTESQVSLPDTDPDSKYNGIWWSEVRNRKNSLLFGSKDLRARDANCFVSAMIHNLLAELYLADSSLEMIPKILQNSLPAINTFKDGIGYNFFPRMSVSPRLENRGEADYYPDGMRRSSHFIYSTLTINHAFHIYNDADDTALAVYANYLSSMLDPGNSEAQNLPPGTLLNI